MNINKYEKKKRKEKREIDYTILSFHSLLTLTRESRTKDGRNIERERRKACTWTPREREREDESGNNGVNEKVPKEEILVGFP